MKKRLIIISSCLGTLLIAFIIFCAVSGFNPIKLLTGTSATGQKVVEETDLKTTLKPLPTDEGLTPLDFSAADNFAMVAYKLETESFYESTTEGAAKANYMGMNVNQGVYDYRMVTPDYIYQDTRSTSTFVKLFSEKFYLNNKVLYRDGDNENYDAFSVGARSISQHEKLYGLVPSTISAHIICDETIINEPTVILNEDGSYTSVFELDPTVAPFYYSRRVKSSGGISKEPYFESIKMTVTYNDKWEVLTIEYDEVYSIYKMKSWILTNNVITEKFNYLDETTICNKYDFYKDYFDMEVVDDEITETPEYQMGALDYIGTMATLITGEKLNLGINVDIDGKKYEAAVSVNLITFDTQIKIDDAIFAYQDNKIYYKAGSKGYIDLEDIAPIIELIESLKDTLGISSSNVNSTGLNPDELMSGIMKDINNGIVNTNDNGTTTVKVDLHLGSLTLPIDFIFNTPNDETIVFSKLTTTLYLKGKNINLSVEKLDDNVKFIEIDDSFEKTDLAFDVILNATLTYEDISLDVDGNIYVDLLNQSISININAYYEDKVINVSLLYKDNLFYVTLNNTVFRITEEDLFDLIDLISNMNSTSTNEDFLSIINEIINNLTFNDKISYNKEVSIKGITISNITLELIESKYDMAIVPEGPYLDYNELNSFIDNVLNIDFNNLDILLNTNIKYNDYELLLNLKYSVSNEYLYLDLKYDEYLLNVIYLDEIVYLSFDDFKYYLNINDLTLLLESFNLNMNNDISKGNIDINNLISIGLAVEILENIKLYSDNNIILEVYDYIVNITSTENSINLSTSNINIDDLYLSNAFISLGNNLISINSLNKDEYQNISFIFDVNLEADIQYDDIEYNLNGNIHVNLFNKEGLINLTLTNNEKTITILVKYINENLYININNIYVMISIENIISLFNDTNISLDKNSLDINLVLSILSNLVFNNINNETIFEYNDSIDLFGASIYNVKAIIKESSNIDIEITDKYINLNDIFDIFDIIKGMKDSINIDLSTKGNYTYNNELINFEVSGDLNICDEITDIEADLDILLNEYKLNIKYINEIIYINYNDAYISVSLEEIMTILDSFNVATNNINIPSINDINIINIAFDLLSKITITSEDNKINIKAKDLIKDLLMINAFIEYDEDIKLTIDAIDYNDLSLEYVDLVLSNEKAIIETNENYVSIKTNLNINLEATVEYNGEVFNVHLEGYFNIIDLEGSFDLTVLLNGKSIIIDVILKDDIIYLTLNEMKFKVELNEFISKNNMNLDNSDIEYNEILDIFNDLLIYSDNKLNIEYSKDINIKGIIVSDIIISLESADYKEITIDEKSYEDINNILEDVKFIYELYKDKKIHIDIKDLIVNYDDIVIRAVGNLDLVYLNDTWQIKAELQLTYDEYVLDLDIVFVENYLYITFSGQTIKLNIDNVDEFINDCMTTLSPILSETEEINIDTNTDIEFGKIFDIINSIFVASGNIDVDLTSLLNDICKISVCYTIINDILNGNLNVNYSDNLDLTLDVSLSTSTIEEIILPTDVITEEDIIKLLEYVVSLYKLKDEKEFYIDFETTINENGNIIAYAFGTVQLRLLGGKEFDARLTLTIYEYSNNIKYAWHSLDINILSATTNNGTAMLYATYGNNEATPSNVVKAYSTYTGILDLIDAVKKLTSLDIMGSVSTVTESKLDLNNIIDLLKVGTNSVSINLDQMAFNSVMLNSEILELTIGANQNGEVNEININNFYLSYTNYRTYMKLMDSSITLYRPLTESDLSVSEKLEIIAPSSLDGYIDLSNLSYLVDALFNTATQSSFRIQGKASLNMLSIYTIDIPLDIKVNVTESGMPNMYIHIDMTDIGLIAQALTSKKNVYIYFYDSYVYIHRVDNSGDEYMIKMHYTTFLDDALYYIMDYAMGLSDTILDLINGAESNGDGFVDASLCVNSASIGTDAFSFSLNLGEITDNFDLENMDITINSTFMELYNEDGSSYLGNALTTISNFDLSMVSVIKLSADGLKLTNIGTNANGNKVFTDVDMTTENQFISDFNSKYKSDEYYVGEDGNFSSDGRIKHNVIFNMGGYTSNVVRKYQEGEKIIFPSYTDNVISVNDNGVTKYYEILGWYTDSSYQNKITDITSLIMPTRKVSYYALLDDVTTNITIKSDYHDDYVITTYKGANIENIIEAKYNVVSLEEGICKFNSLLYNGNIYDYTNVIEGEYTLNVVWDKVVYSFYAVYDENTYLLDATSETSFINEDVIVYNKGTYYIYDGSMLTPKFLLETFASLFVVNEDDERIEIKLYLVSSKTDEFEDSNYNKITFSSDSRFNNVKHKGIYTTKVSTNITSYLPTGSYGSYEINAWVNNGTYLSLTDLKSVNESLSLVPSISTKQEFFTFEFYNNNTEAQITGYSGTASVVIFPRYATISGNDYVVTLLATLDTGGSAFSGNTTITKVILNDGLTTVGANAFKDCTSLTSVYFADSVTSVATDAFYFTTGSNFEKNRDYALAIKFYFTSNSSCSKSDWLACKWNSTSKYYGKSNSGFLGMGKVDLSNSFTTYSDALYNIAISSI